MSNNIVDPTNVGTGGLKGINTQSGRDRIAKEFGFSTSIQDFKQNRALSRPEAPYQEVGRVGIGDSSYDQDISSLTQLEDLENTRGELQPWYSQLAAGVGKGAVLAGTTFLDGTVGTVVGAINMVEAASAGGDSSEVIGAFWNNPFAKLMKGVNDWSEEVMPNYMTEEERENQQNGEWYKNIWTANWWGNSFIKNLGFTVGAFATGNLVSGAMKGAPAMLKSFVGSAISAINEGKIEAYNNAHEWHDYERQKLDDAYSKYLDNLKQQYEGTEMYPMLLAKAESEYNASLDKLAENMTHVGNVDLALNIPILTASNAFMWGKLYAGGAKTARTGVNVARRNGKYVSNVSPIKIITGPLSEGAEEVEQKAASVIPGTKYGSEIENFYLSKWDPDAATEVLDWTQATASGISEVLGDPNSWEEFTIGAMTGVLGMPMFRSTRSEDGKFRSPIYLGSGTLNEVRDYLRDREESQAMADRLNQRVQSPEFLNYYQGAVRHTKYQNDMNKAAEEGNTFEYKNAEDSQLISDVIMFANAGRLNDLTEYINQAFDTSDENIQSIIENTTDEYGNGPFSSNNNALPKEEIVSKLTKAKDDINNAISEYNNIKNFINSRLGSEINDEALEELIWLGAKSKVWDSRFNSIIDEVRQQLNRAASDNEFRHPDDKAETPSTIKELLSMPNSLIKFIIADSNNKDIRDAIVQEAERVSSTYGLDYADLVEKAQDMIKVAEASNKFWDGLNEYIESPEKLMERQANDRQRVEQADQIKKTDDLVKALNAASSVSELRDILDNSDADSDTKASALSRMESEDNQIVKNYKETSKYNAEISKALSTLGLDSNTLNDANLLWQEQFNAAENLEQLANPNSIFINNEDAFIEDSEGDVDMAESRFQNARYALQRAMSKVNNDIRFKNRFSDEYRKPVDEPIRGKGTDKDSTGDSGTPTVPHVNPNATPIETPSVPVGNVTTEMVASENRDANRRVETQRSLDQSQQGQRRYYRPAVPELHIEASKEGDFRPFDVVVAEREPGVDFSGIYNYLRDNGAFSYVNAAKIKPGDTLGFMIDPDFNDHTIFLVDTRNNQIVGSIDESDASVARYEGLAEVIKKVRDEYQASRQGAPSYNMRTGLLSEEYVNSIIRNSPEIPYETLTWSNEQNKAIASSGKSRVIDMGGRKIVVLDINGFHMPFYLSTGHGGKADVASGKWYPIFGIGQDNWLNKLSGTEINDYYGSPIFRQISEALDRIYGDIREDKSVPSVKATGSHIDFINQDLNPTENGNQNTKELVEKNIEEAKAKVVEAASKLTTSAPATGKFFATPQTRVSKMMVGRIPYGTEDRSLADIPGVLDGNTKPIFGIIKNGALTTNEKIDDRLIIKPVDMAQKEGRLYLLIPNAAGTYSPAAVRVKHFNNQEFNLDDATVANTPIGRGINEALDRLADATSQDDVSVAMKELAQDIYMQDVMVTWFDAKAGSGIVISRKVRKSDGTYEMVNINGQEQIKENKYTIYYQSSKKSIDINGLEYTYEAAKESGVDMSLFGQPRDITEIRRDILNTILGFNLPIQVSASRINDSGYNNRVIKSNVLTSNLREAKVIGSWFTTDYFDKQGNLQRSVSPSSVKPAPSRRTTTPVGGTEGVIQGTPVRVGNSTYTVNLKTMIYTDSKGVKYAATTSNANIFAMAWAQENFGDSTESSVMTENKVITPQGRVLDRNTGTYVSDAEAKRIKDKIAGRNQAAQNRIAESKRVIADIYENQKRVDKARTDSDYYYILEDDGQYHEYSRVHSRLGDNWLGERTETENSRRALEAGTAVDKVIRDFFTSKETPVKPETLSESAFIDLISKLTEIKSKMEQMGEAFMADNIVLFQKYADGTRVAGEVDILSVDKNGSFKIYDVKTSRYSFGDRYFTEKSSKQRMSTKDYYTLQLSAYQNLFESQYGVRPVRLAILPFVLSYDKDRVASITGEKGILIEYNPAVNVPLASAVQAPQQQEFLPIFDALVDGTMETENRALPENDFDEHGGAVGVYEKEGKLYTGYLKKIGEVEVTYGSGQKDMVPVHVTKVRDRGFGRAGEFGSTSEYIVVFPNGYAMTVVKRSASDSEAFKLIMDALSAKPEKVLSLSNEKTQIYNPRMLEEIETELRNRQYSETTQPSGAATTIQREDSINNHDEEFEDELDLGELRRVDDSSRELWNQEKELAWIKRVLPQLSEQDRVRVVKGLIRVANQGAVAWGSYQNGIITLSDVAAEGTTYHEAFHAVFDLLLSEDEKAALLNEAREKWGDLAEQDLKEELAEAFREYMSSREDRSLGRKILDFFKELFAKVTNFKFMKPSMTAYFQMINQGRYSRETLGKSSQEEAEYRKKRVIADTRLNSAIRDSHIRGFVNGTGDSRMTKDGHGYYDTGSEVIEFHFDSDRNVIIDHVSIDERGAKSIKDSIEYEKRLEDSNRENLDSLTQQAIDKAYPNGKWNSISLEEREQFLECKGL